MALISWLAHFFDQTDFMPHGHCYLWMPALVWTHVVTDMLIGLAYVSISLSLYFLIRKIKLPFSAVVLSFGVFIGACGATHFMEVWNLWHADYWVAGFVKAITAIASVATGVWLIRLKPQIIAMAETAKLAEQHRLALEATNRELGEKTAELMRTNQLLEEQQKVLAHSAKMSALGEMAGGIAHEINSPLGIITIHANQIERFQARGLLTPEFISSEAQLIASTAKRIGNIINGLRAFAREGDRDPFELTQVRLILQDALVLCQNKFASHGVELILQESPPDLEIQCRAVQIGQVILNLLNNAYDAVQTVEVKWVKIEVKDLGEMVSIAIGDSGPGIAPELRSKIMQPFFTTKEVGKGTGLGLSISKGIMDTHHGTLELNTLSPHTEFVVTIPKVHHLVAGELA